MPLPSVCSRTHQSLLTLLPSIWCAAVAAPHRKSLGKRAETASDTAVLTFVDDECWHPAEMAGRSAHFTPAVATLWMKYRCSKTNNSTIGVITSTDPASSRPYFVALSPVEYNASITGRVYISSL